MFIQNYLDSVKQAKQMQELGYCAGLAVVAVVAFVGWYFAGTI